MYLINLLVIIGIYLLAMTILEIQPFGLYSYCSSDGCAQFKPFIFDLLTKMKLGILQPYTFNSGLGNPTYFNFLYYTPSPINLIGLFFKKAENMYFAISIVKLGIASLCMTKYASSKTNNKIAIFIANVAYCFCGWYVVYYYYLSFIDIFMIFPLFQYGLEKLLNENKAGIYIFTLAYMILTNFYLCFAVCVYTILYFIIVRIFYNQDTKEEKLKSFLSICKATLIVAIIMFFWLYMILDSYFRMELSFITNPLIDYYLSIPKLIASLFYGQFELLVEYYGETNPNIGCNTIILISLLFYFFNPKIEIREKVYVFLTALICINALLVTKFDYVLNFFHEIRGLPYRYSFIICFLEICLFLRNVDNFDSNKKSKWGLIISLLIIVLFGFIARSYLCEETIIRAVVISLSLMVLFFLKPSKKITSIIIVFLLILESTLTLVDFSFVSPFLRETINLSYKKQDDTFRYGHYRDVITDKKKLEIATDYNGSLYDNSKELELMSSMTYNKSIVLLNRMGFPTFLNTTINYDESNIMGNMLFNIKNDYYLERIFSVDKSIKNLELKQDDIVNNQNKIAQMLAGVDNIFIIKKEEVDPIYTFDNYYKSTGFIDLKDKNGKIHTYNHMEIIGVRLNSNYNTEVTRYFYDEKKVKEVHDVLKQNQIHYTSFKDSKIEGTIQVDKNQMIYTSIPYDTNWIIKIDGKKVKPTRIFDALIGIETTPGKHKISMEYKTHFRIPIIISLISLVIYLYEKYYKKREFLK